MMQRQEWMNLMQVLAICFSLFLNISLYSETITEDPIFNMVQGDFSDCKVEKKPYYLTKSQDAELEKISGVSTSSLFGTQFKISCSNVSPIYGYIDSHIVRSLNETLALYIQNDSVVNVKIVDFSEPKEYMPSGKWIEQFHGIKLKEDLRIGGDIDGITGATLSAKSVTYAVRRVLSLNQILKTPDVLQK